MSVAVRAAQKLFQLGMQDLLDSLASDRGLLTREALRSNLRGGYLGDQAEDSLANFEIFLNNLAPVLGENAENDTPSLPDVELAFSAQSCRHRESWQCLDHAYPRWNMIAVLGCPVGCLLLSGLRILIGSSPERTGSRGRKV